MKRLELGSNWEIRQEPIYYSREHYAEIEVKEDGWLPVASLPCDVHVPLIDNGIIGDPVVADNSFKCEWIEDRSWWFRKVFNADDRLIKTHNSELVIEGLDVKADLFLNGTYLGHHASALYPFRKDVRDILKNGTNILIIRLTSGLEYYSDQDLSKIKDWISCEYKGGRGPRGDNRRAMVRKPQYVYGWDWTPRMATCGIMGDARIEVYNEIAVRDIRFVTRSISGAKGVNGVKGQVIKGQTAEALTADITVEAEIENLYPISTMDVNVELDIWFEDLLVAKAEKEVFMISGMNYVTFDVTVNQPKLWWPNGMGAQNLYRVRVSADTPNKNIDSDSREIMAGIRKLKLNMDKINDSSRLFVFEINGIKTFCKGGNWETPDSIYGRVTDEKYEALVKEAKEANFNMFRVNGCNAYERDFFYDCCNRYGIMVWQDFAGFSCAAYPDELDWFRAEVAKEVDYQTRRLRNNPCVVLWCGNNECLGHLAVYRPGGYWAGEKKPASPGGTVLYNEIMPRIIKENCPDIPYWNSSPYGGVTDLESNDYGDRHHWIFMSRDMDERITPEEYDKIACKFVSEFGCVGPTKKSSTFRYYGSENIDMDSNIWKMHTNTFEKNTIKAAIAKHYTDKKDLSLDEYILYAGMFQGVMLEYALDSMRYTHNNYGALVWSFNEAWGEVGWGIIDYYLVRKISFYFVKRAFAPIRLIMREDEQGIVSVVCMNESMSPLNFELEYGYVSFDGDKKDTTVKKVMVEPREKAVVVAQIALGGLAAKSVQAAQPAIASQSAQPAQLINALQSEQPANASQSAQPAMTEKASYDNLRGLIYAKSTAENDGIMPVIFRAADFRKLLAPEPDIRVLRFEKCESESGDERIAIFTVTSDKYAHGVHFNLNDEILLSDEYFDLLPGEIREIAATYKAGNLNAGDIKAAGVYVK